MIDKREERLNQYKALFSNRNKADEYIQRLIDSNFALGFLDALNELVNGIESILPGANVERQKRIIELAKNIETKISERKKIINDIQERMNSNFSSKEFEILFNLSFESFTREFLVRLLTTIKLHIDGLTEMSQFSKEETVLREFCIKQGIPEIEIAVKSIHGEYDEYK